jgi:hypothetical protein
MSQWSAVRTRARAKQFLLLLFKFCISQERYPPSSLLRLWLIQPASSLILLMQVAFAALLRLESAAAELEARGDGADELMSSRADQLMTVPQQLLWTRNISLNCTD